jgi:hypothetical protein
VIRRQMVSSLRSPAPRPLMARVRLPAGTRRA